MAIKKNNTNTNKEEKKMENNMKYAVMVSNVKEIPNREGCYRFQLEVNGVKIYGMQYIHYTTKAGKEGDLISFPSYKGSDGEFYNNCWFPCGSDTEAFKEIEKQLEVIVNGK